MFGQRSVIRHRGEEQYVIPSFPNHPPMQASLELTESASISSEADSILPEAAVISPAFDSVRVESKRYGFIVKRFQE